MRLPQFTLHQPATVEDAVAVLARNPGARLLAGGTDLLVNMKLRVERPETLVGLGRVTAMRGVTREDGRTVIGGRTTLKDIQNDPFLLERYPALVQAARAVGSYRHQTMGTLAGNLCQNTRCRFYNQSLEWRSVRSPCYKAGGEDCHVMNKKGVCCSTYSGDVAPALLALDAQVRLQGPEGTREIPLSGLYSGEGKSPLTLGPAEVLTAVVLPDSSGNGRSCYLKQSLRGSIDFPIVGAAVARFAGGVRVAYTAVDRSPVRAAALESALEGRPLTEDLIEQAAPLARKAATITRTTTQPVPYKRELMAALFRKAARTLV
ncbi:MAG: xanthine dehydrogenase family protein subunit M [Thermoleophilia bacterium]